MTALHITGDKSPTVPYWEKKLLSWSSETSMGTPDRVRSVFLVPMYFVYNLTGLVVNMLPANFFAASPIVIRMSHIILLHFTNILAIMYKLFRVSSIVPMLKPTNFLVLASVAIRKIVLVDTDPRQTVLYRARYPRCNLVSL